MYPTIGDFGLEGVAVCRFRHSKTDVGNRRKMLKAIFHVSRISLIYCCLGTVNILSFPSDCLSNFAVGIFSLLTSAFCIYFGILTLHFLGCKTLYLNYAIYRNPTLYTGYMNKPIDRRSHYCKILEMKKQVLSALFFAYKKNSFFLQDFSI